MPSTQSGPLPASFEDSHNLTIRIPGMLQRPHSTLVCERVGASGPVSREVVASFGLDPERLSDDGEQLLGTLGGLQDLDDEEAARHAGQDTAYAEDGQERCPALAPNIFPPPQCARVPHDERVHDDGRGCWWIGPATEGASDAA